MKYAIIAIIIVILAVILGYLFASPKSGSITPTPPTNEVPSEPESDSPAPKDGEVSVLPVEHASLVLTWKDRRVVVDPVGDPARYGGASPLLILVTDIHQDHFSSTTLAALAGKGTRLVVPQAVADKLTPDLFNRALVLKNGASTTLGGMTIEAVPMYNLPEDEKSFHTKGRGNGYLVTMGGTRVYIAGDTSDTPEMRALAAIDIAFVPMNLPYTMTVDAAASATLEFKPKRVYPYHYRGTDGKSDIVRFKTLVTTKDPGIEVVLHDWYGGK